MHVKPGTRLRWSFVSFDDTFTRGVNVYRVDDETTGPDTQFYASKDWDAGDKPIGSADWISGGGGQYTWQVPVDAPATLYEGALRIPRVVQDYCYDQPLNPGNYSVSTLLREVRDVLQTTMIEEHDARRSSRPLHVDVLFHAAENRFTFLSDDADTEGDFAIVLADPSLAALLGFEPGTHVCDEDGEIQSTCTPHSI